MGEGLKVWSARGSAVVIGALAVVACGPESAPPAWVARTDTIADTVVVHTVSGSVWGDSVRVVETLAIGGLDGPDEVLFGEVFRMAEDLEGGIYVFDRQGPVLRHYDGSGDYIGTLGRAGQGPGEYSWMSLGMAVDPNGVLFLSDWGNGRVARFAPYGEALDPWPLTSGFFTTAPGPGVFTNGPGRVLVRASVQERPGLIVMDAGVATDTLLVPELPGLPPERGGPYRVDTYWDWTPDGHFVVGVSDSYSFEVHGPSGVTRVSRDVPGLPVHPDEAAAWTRRFQWMEGRPNYRPPEGEWLPSEMPPFRGLAAGSDGRVWVRRNVEPMAVEVDAPQGGPPPVGWTQPFVCDVFESDGTYLGEVRFPDRFEPHLFGAGHVWGVRRGDLDEEYVVRLELRGPR